MKAVKLTMVVLLVALAALGGWFFGKGSTSEHAHVAGATRKILHYQCSMHPWIRSDQPGNCTICGMKLTPVYEGESGIAMGTNMVSLSPGAVTVVNVQTESVTKRPLERQIDVAGKIEPDETRRRVISAYVDGRIDRLFVNYIGAEVEENQPLALLYSPTLLTAEREYLTVSQASNNVADAGMRLNYEALARDAAQRLKRLGLSDEQIAKLGKREATNYNTRILAPMSGTVVSRAVFEGQYVKEGDKLFEIADLSKMWFRFEVYEQDLAWVKTGQRVEVTTSANPGKVLQGKIVFIDPNINESSRSARARVELENPLVEENGVKQRDLFNGLYATGRIKVESEPVLAVARGAVLQPGKQARVYVDMGSHAYEAREVRLGRAGENYWEVLAGLDAGEKVVSSGNLLLDSQAELNRQTVSRSPAEIIQEQGGLKVQLSAAQSTPVKEFFTFASALGQSLAADSLEEYNDKIVHASHYLAPLVAAFPAGTKGQDSVAQIAKAGELKRAESLDQARKEFIPLSIASADFARSIEASSTAVGVHVYQCPMYPAPGKAARWVQMQEPLRNPFYGSAMIDCGNELK